jgi:GntR family transcriptional regulator/MocR family aminotransferase
VEVLRKTISNYLNLRRNVQCDYSQVFILSGSLQSLYLIGNLLLNPGDEVILENPTFPNAHSVFKSLRAKITGVDIDHQGIVVEGLGPKITSGAKLMHLTPSHHYPLGVRMSDQRKEEVLALANEKGLYIVENDYENEINHLERDGKPIFSLDRQDRTFYLGTFNRTLHPSIRVGFVIVPRHLVANFHAMVMHSHRFVSPTGQVVLRGFIEKNYLHEHLKNVAREAQLRKVLFTEFLESELSGQLRIVKSLNPSLHITALLKNDVSDTKVVSALAEKGIVAHALSKCYVSPDKQQGLIFGYSSVKPRHMKPIMNKMAEILKKVSR